MPKKQENQEFKEFDIASLIEPDGAIRLEIPEESIIELAESMKELGLIQPIVISEQEGQYEIVVGHRRWMAAKRLGWEKIDAIVRTLDRTQIALIRATENLQREGLSYLEEAAIYADLHVTHKLSLNQIAGRVGKSFITVKNRLDLLTMDDGIQKAIHDKKINPSVAVELNKIEREIDLKRYLTLSIEEGVTAKVVARWVDDLRKSLLYSPNTEGGGSPHKEETREKKYFTMCQFCEEAVEYKDLCRFEICKRCYDLTLNVVAQGHYKKGGE